MWSTNSFFSIISDKLLDKPSFFTALFANVLIIFTITVVARSVAWDTFNFWEVLNHPYSSLWMTIILLFLLLISLVFWSVFYIPGCIIEMHITKPWLFIVVLANDIDIMDYFSSFRYLYWIKVDQLSTILLELKNKFLEYNIYVTPNHNQIYYYKWISMIGVYDVSTIIHVFLFVLFYIY